VTRARSDKAQVLQPAGWLQPKGYSNGVAVRGRQVYIGGQIGWNAQAQFDSERLSDQVRQTLANILAVLAEAGGKPEHIVRLTWFITSRDEYLAQQKEIGEAYRAVMGRVFPPMSVVQVAALIERQARVEIEATAVIPDVE
jgi:enamine deaminase RidA (YjgF/YER057c/UK114 family)